MNRLWQCLSVLVALASLATLIGGGTALAAQRTFGLVVGIDKYPHQPLHGAVADAKDIADALTSMNAQTTLLLDDDATRDRIFAAWDDILAQAQPGDLIVFSYAGHGSQEPEAVPGSEEDGLDENFLLAGYTPEAPGNANRIRDDEIYDKLRQASAKTVLFIADSCHSGTMTRAVSRWPKPGSRYMDYGTIVDDQLPPPPSRELQAGADDLGHVLFLAGVADHLEVMEVPINGQNRGALSYAAAQGLRGGADQDGDGGISRHELEAFVRTTMLALTQGRQQLQADGSARGGNITAPKPFELALDNVSEEEQAAIVAALPPNIHASTDKNAAALLTWEVANKVVVGRDGFMVASLSSPTETGKEAGEPLSNTRSAVRVGRAVGDAIDWRSQLDMISGIAAKFILADRLGHAMLARPLAMTLTPEAHFYRNAEKLEITISMEQEQYLTLFNVGPAGDIHFLYPLAEYKDSPMLPASEPFMVPTQVKEPFGAEHFIAISSRERPTHLQTMLQKMDGQILVSASADQLAAEIRASGGRIGLVQATTGQD
jgi:uncharacterized caspase-like protein